VWQQQITCFTSVVEARPGGTSSDMPVGKDVRLADGVKIFQPDLVNLYGCTVGSETKSGAFVEIQKNAVVGVRCKISSHAFICEGVTIAPSRMRSLLVMAQGLSTIAILKRPLVVACKPRLIGK